MAPAPDPATRTSDREEPTRSTTIASLDVSFERRLDRWLSLFRLAVGFAGLLLVVSLVSELRWSLIAGAAYLTASGSVFPLLRMAGDDPRAKLRLRLCILVVDVVTVSAFVYGWGSRASPAMLLYVPIVVGWTLVPEQRLGRAALVLVLVSLAVVLLLENPSLALQPPLLRGGRWLFFGIAGVVLVSVHTLLAYTVRQLVVHSRLLSALRVEKQALEREAAWAARLEEAQRLEALGRLAGGVAHDFNNLLTALIGCAEVAESCLESAPDVAASALRDLQRAAERGAGLTAQLLDAASRRPAQPRNVDLNDAVANTAQLLTRLLRDDVALRVTPSDGPLGVRIDPSSLERLLLNLSVNAADAMPSGGELSISVHSEGPGLGRVVLEVIDTGKGIAPEDLAHIFEPFFTNKARGKGTGLGLASVYGIVKQSGGTIDVESKLGVGTRFRVAWPRVDAPQPAPLAAAEVPARAQGTVLLVDDDETVRRVGEAHLRSAGYRVYCAESGARALALVEHEGQRFDALITDVSMPGMSGVELVERLRQAGHALPVLLVSGYADELQSGGSLGARGDVAFLAKPFSRDRLTAEVERLLRRVPSSPEPRGA
jgi:two-component system, cell cycle sensor histidine kinase and response regulator CckA